MQVLSRDERRLLTYFVRSSIKRVLSHEATIVIRTRGGNVPALEQFVIALREQPIITEISVTEGPPVSVTPVLARAEGKTYVTIILGSGHIRQYARSIQGLQFGESMHLPEEGISSRNLVATTPIPQYIIKELINREPCTRLVCETVLNHAARAQSVQEAFLAGLLGQLDPLLVELESQVGRLYLQGSSLPSCGLAEHVGKALQLSAARDLRYHYEPDPIDSAYYSQLMPAISRYLSRINLLTHGTASLDDGVTIQDISQLYAAELRTANRRARVLRNAVAKVYGFVEVVLMGAPLDDRRGWLKLPTGEGVAQSGARGADKGRPAVFVFTKLKERRPTVLITESYKVYVNGKLRCITDAGNARGLPHADYVARLMLALGSHHRESISTLDKDEDSLRALFVGTPYETLAAAKRRVLKGQQID